jgi:crotonobetainyl-CoA:carnitine CoA-transferase CaiB-like acyl-CoA transferase
MVAYNELGIVRERAGNKAGLFQPYDVFQAADGWVIIAAVGTPYNRVCEVLGIDPTEEKWRKAHQEVDSPEGIEFDSLLRAWAGNRTVGEIVETMNAAQVACCPIMTPKDAAEDPHYKMRDMHIEWEDVQLGRKVKGIGVVPKMSETPGKIWRGSVGLGYDNELVFNKLLGLDSSEVERLKEEGVL